MFKIQHIEQYSPDSRNEPDVTSNMQDHPACNIICVAIYNELPAGHILSPTTAGFASWRIDNHANFTFNRDANLERVTRLIIHIIILTRKIREKSTYIPYKDILFYKHNFSFDEIRRVESQYFLEPKGKCTNNKTFVKYPRRRTSTVRRPILLIDSKAKS